MHNNQRKIDNANRMIKKYGRAIEYHRVVISDATDPLNPIQTDTLISMMGAFFEDKSNIRDFAYPKPDDPKITVSTQVLYITDPGFIPSQSDYIVDVFGRYEIETVKILQVNDNPIVYILRIEK